jgi:threonine aldolase
MRVDLRSDTVTKPTKEMRDAMATAEVGDDVFGDDPTVNALQSYVASLLGKERGLFVPSGTMSNQLALRAHTRSGDEIMAHEGCHIWNYESGAAASLAGLAVRCLKSKDGSLPLDALAAGLHQTDDPHFAPTTLITLENTHNACGGIVVAQDHVDAVVEFGKAKKVGLHLDGARLCNASAATGLSLERLARGFDTVSICLSKGLGAPVGSVLVGSERLIQRAYRYRKMYGGGMRQAGVLAAAGLYALKNNRGLLEQDHVRARYFADEVSKLAGITAIAPSSMTNLVYFELAPSHSLAGIGSDGTPKLVSALAQRGVLITGGATRFRAAFHLDVADDGLSYALGCFKDLF